MSGEGGVVNRKVDNSLDASIANPEMLNTPKFYDRNV